MLLATINYNCQRAIVLFWFTCRVDITPKTNRAFTGYIKCVSVSAIPASLPPYTPTCKYSIWFVQRMRLDVCTTQETKRVYTQLFRLGFILTTIFSHKLANALPYMYIYKYSGISLAWVINRGPQAKTQVGGKRRKWASTSICSLRMVVLSSHATLRLVAFLLLFGLFICFLNIKSFFGVCWLN